MSNEIHSDRLILRNLQPDDDKQIFKIRSNEIVNKYIDRAPTASIEDAHAHIQMLIDKVEKKESYYWAIVLKNNQLVIGTICLFHYSENNSKAELGFELLPEYHNQGIMKEAAAEVIKFSKTAGFSKLEAFTHNENTASIRTLQKFGFKTTVKSDGYFLNFEKQL